MKKIYVFYILLVIIPPFCFSQKLGQGQEKLSPEQAIVVHYILKCYGYLRRPLPSGFERYHSDSNKYDYYIGDSIVFQNGNDHILGAGIVLLTKKNEDTVIEAQFGDLFSTLRDASYYHATIIGTLELLELKYFKTDKTLNCDIYTDNGKFFVMVFPPDQNSDKAFLVPVWITDIFGFERYTN
jgi:hypothetical protein